MILEKFEQILAVLDNDVHAKGILREINKLAERDNLTDEQYMKLKSKVVMTFVNHHPEANRIYHSA